MNENLQNALTTLAEKFGTTVEHLWTVMLRQAVINGVFDLLQCLAIGILTYLFIRFCKYFQAKEKAEFGDSFMDDLGYPLFYVFGALTIGVLWLFAISFFYDALTCFFNPEYWALRQILNK